MSKIIKDLTGQQFGKLTVLEMTDQRAAGAIVWKCRCECGSEIEVSARQLCSGDTKSCGCLRSEQQINDLTGQRFGSLVVLEPTEKRRNGSVVWKCICDCGQITDAHTTALRRGQKKSCGCKMGRPSKDLTGQKFNKLVAIEPTSLRIGRSVVWLCQCECQNIVQVSANHLQTGKVKSCGCLRKKNEPATPE